MINVLPFLTKPMSAGGIFCRIGFIVLFQQCLKVIAHDCRRYTNVGRAIFTLNDIGKNIYRDLVSEMIMCSNIFPGFDYKLYYLDQRKSLVL